VRRRLFNSLAAVSLVLFLIVIVTWMRSAWRVRDYDIIYLWRIDPEISISVRESLRAPSAMAQPDQDRQYRGGNRRAF